MSDDARRLLTEEERARIRAARERGGMCARCGRALPAREPVWIEHVVVGVKAGTRRAPISWRVPVGIECAAPDFRAEAEGRQPEPCLGCGRGVYHRVASPCRYLPLCSRACGHRFRRARAREETNT